MAAHSYIFVLSLALVFCAIPQATLADSGTATYYTEYVRKCAQTIVQFSPCAVYTTMHSHTSTIDLTNRLYRTS